MKKSSVHDIISKNESYKLCKSNRKIRKEVGLLSKNNISYALTDGYSIGSDGSINLANKVLKELQKENNFNYAYELEDPIKEKIYKVATKIYGCTNVIYSKMP